MQASGCESKHLYNTLDNLNSGRKIMVIKRLVWSPTRLGRNLSKFIAWSSIIKVKKSPSKIRVIQHIEKEHTWKYDKKNKENKVLGS